jgi:hypothetical protein
MYKEFQVLNELKFSYICASTKSSPTDVVRLLINLELILDAIMEVERRKLIKKGIRNVGSQREDIMCSAKTDSLPQSFTRICIARGYFSRLHTSASQHYVFCLNIHTNIIVCGTNLQQPPSASKGNQAKRIPMVGRKLRIMALGPCLIEHVCYINT